MANWELRFFPFSIRHSQASIFHTQFTTIVSWEWRIENGDSFYSQISILKQAFCMFYLKWWLVENEELRIEMSLRELRMEMLPANISIFNSLFSKWVILAVDLQCLSKTRIENGEKKRLFENKKLRSGIALRVQIHCMRIENEST
jgi:hypothetical protein